MEKRKKIAASRQDPPPLDSPPVFIHSSWRTSSTWLWSAFRKPPSTVAYCEIFHEDLASIEKQRIAGLGPSSWRSRHPSGAPYFLEFLALAKPGGGIMGYHPSMAIEHFVPASGLGGSITLNEVAYVGSLIEYARSLDKQPVLTDTRTLGRLSALKRQFGGTHIFLYRNLLHQWASYTEQAYEGNFYFLQMLKEVIEKNQHDPFIRDLNELHPLGEPDYRSNNFFMAFLLLHLYLYCNALVHADIVIDATKLASDRQYRAVIESSILKKTAIPVELSDARSNFEFSFVIPEDLNELRERVAAAVDLIKTILRPKKKRVRQLEDLVQEFLDEVQRHKFYADGARRIVCREGGLLDIKAGRDAAVSSANMLSEQRNQLVAELNAALAERDALTAELTELARQRDSLAAERDAAWGERDSLHAERNSLATQRESLTAERDTALTERNKLQGERDDLATQSESLAAERDAAWAERIELRSQRDSLAESRETLIAERDVASTERDDLRSERDDLARQHDGLTAERDAAWGERDLLRNERNDLSTQHESLIEEREIARAEREKLQCERDELLKQRDDLVGERDRLLDERARDSRQMLVSQPARDPLWKRSILKLIRG